MAISKDRLDPVACAALVVAAVLATIPVLEMGTNDDWSYTWVARQLAATGRLSYNGWIGAMIGVQAVWAAWLIRLFGFSFTLVRLSTLPFAAGCAILLYHLGRSAGLNPSFARFASLSVTLSPVFIPVAASFMTDVPGCFFWLACVCCAVRAAQTAVPMRACIWMAAAAVAGVAGGTVRQVVWFVPLLTLPAVAWLRRRERTSMIGAILLWCAAALAIALCANWFLAQANVTPLPHVQGSWLDFLQDTAETGLQIVVPLLLLLMPVLALYLWPWRTWLRKPIALALGLLIPGALLGGLLALFEDDLLIGNMITPAGILDRGMDMLGVKPEILTPPIRFLLGLATAVTTGVTVAMLWIGLRSPRAEESKEGEEGEEGEERDGEEDAGLQRFLLLFGPACAVYVLTLVYHGVRDWILFDRYLIPLLPLVIVPLLWNFQRRIRETPPAWGWALLGLLAFFGIASTHDYLAAGRARVRAASSAIAAGIPRTHISAGLEYDAWTQLEQTGLISTPPANAPPRQYRVSPPYWFWDRTPSVDPIYLVTYSLLPGLVDSGFPPIHYTAWLPPFHRRIYIQRVPPQ